MKLNIINPTNVQVDFDNHIIKVEVEDGSLYEIRTKSDLIILEK